LRPVRRTGFCFYDTPLHDIRAGIEDFDMVSNKIFVKSDIIINKK